MNRAVFFDHVRPLFGNRMTQAQVAGVGLILDEGAARGITDNRKVAYALATAFHETGRRMQPVREGFAKSSEAAVRYLESNWAKGRLKSVKTPYWRPDADGKAWFGRGLVQITHKRNYALLGPLVGVDLLADPELACDPLVSVKILYEGMFRAVSLKGDFTGRSVEEFIDGPKCDYVGARKCVNGTDQARKIAGYAEKFETALNAASQSGEDVEMNNAVAEVVKSIGFGKRGRTVSPVPITNMPIRSGKEVVEKVQRELTRLKYHEVGTIDGIEGKRTESAIDAFRGDNRLPKTGKIDDALIVALAKAKPRKIPDERANATAQDIKDRAPIVREGLAGQIISGGTAAIGGGAAAIPAIEQYIERGEQVAGQVERVGGMLDTLSMISTYALPVIVVIGGGAAFIYFGRIVWRRVRMHQEGELA